MNIKSFSVCFFLGLCLAVSTTAQTVQYISLETAYPSPGVQYTLQTNQIVSLVGMYGGGTVLGNFPDGNGMVFGIPSSGQFQSFTGLTSLTAKAGSAQVICPTFKIMTPAAVNVVSNYVPADAIVIPASATGNVQIILESSPDLVNWTAASPGTYGASAGTNRFFRVRAAVGP